MIELNKSHRFKGCIDVCKTSHGCNGATQNQKQTLWMPGLLLLMFIITVLFHDK